VKRAEEKGGTMGRFPLLFCAGFGRVGLCRNSSFFFTLFFVFWTSHIYLYITSHTYPPVHLLLSHLPAPTFTFSISFSTYSDIVDMNVVVYAAAYGGWLNKRVPSG